MWQEIPKNITTIAYYLFQYPPLNKPCNQKKPNKLKPNQPTKHRKQNQTTQMIKKPPTNQKLLKM